MLAKRELRPALPSVARYLLALSGSAGRSGLVAAFGKADKAGFYASGAIGGVAANHSSPPIKTKYLYKSDDICCMDVLTKEQRRKNMQAIKSKDTKIEVILAKALWSKGFRYNKNNLST